MHGYAIMVDVEERTGGQLIIGPGTLYSSIKRLLKAGWIEESDERQALIWMTSDGVTTA